MTAMDRLLAGRIAEELIYGDALVSTRSKGELICVKKLCHEIMKYKMSL